MFSLYNIQFQSWFKKAFSPSQKHYYYYKSNFKNLIALLTLSLVFCFNLAPSIVMANEEIQMPTQLNAYDFNSNKNIQLDLNNETNVIVFLSAKCPCSNSHIEHLKYLKKQYPKVQFIAVHSNADEELELAKQYFAKSQLNFPALQDNKAQIANQLKAFKTPHAYVFHNKQLKYIGGVSNSNSLEKATTKYLEEVLFDITNNKTLRWTETRTLGCFISRG